MSRHIEAYMDNIPLSSVGPLILQQVYEDPPAVEITEGERPGRAGTRFVGSRRQSVKIALEVAVRELYDLSRRARAVEALAAWASGSVLELSDHPDQRLHVACTAVPALGQVRDYTAVARVELTAYDIPYWEDKRPSTLTLTAGSTGSGSLYVPGTAPSPVNVSVSVVSGTLTELAMDVGGEVITLEDLSVAAGGTVQLTHTAADDLVIRAGSTGIMSARTPDSADDFIPATGYAAVSYTADTDVAITFSVHGRWA